jgi:hypothetical protein
MLQMMLCHGKQMQCEVLSNSFFISVSSCRFKIISAETKQPGAHGVNFVFLGKMNK